MHLYSQDTERLFHFNPPLEPATFAYGEKEWLKEWVCI
jgi:hypothetical protein